MGAYFTISSIIYIAIFIYYFFSKNSVKTKETKIYKILLITTFYGLCLDALSFFIYKKGVDPNSFFYQTLAKGMLIYFLVWIGTFTYYIFVVSHNAPDEDNKIKVNRFGNILRVLITLIMIVAFVLPITFDIKNETIFPIGLGVNLTYITVAICLVVCFFFAFKNYKHILLHKYTPLFMMVILVGLSALIQKIFPELFLVNFSIATVVMLLYFSIENPDIKVIEELTYSKELLKRANDATNKSLNMLTKEIAKPIEVLYHFGNKKIDSNNYEELLKEMKELQKNSIKIVDRINGMIELSKLENENNELNQCKYDSKELLDDIKHLLIAQNNNLNKENRFIIEDDIKKVLYGDPLKIKKTIAYISNYLLEKSNAKDIVFKISDTSTKTKTRLRFSFIVNNDFYKKEFLDEGIESEIINRLIELQDAKLEISEDNGKTVVDFLIYQKHLDEYEVSENKIGRETLIKYCDCQKKKVLIVDDNLDKINLLIELLNPYNLSISIAHNYEEYESNIYNSIKWDLILIDDMMPDTKKFEFFSLNDKEKNDALENIEKLTNEKMPLVVMLTPNKNDDNVLYDHLLKPIDKNELDKIVKKYLVK